MEILRQIDLELVSIDITLSGGLGTEATVEIIDDDGHDVIRPKKFRCKRGENRIDLANRAEEWARNFAAQG